MFRKTMFSLLTMAALVSSAALTVNADDCIYGNCGGGSATAGSPFYYGAGGAGGNAYGAMWGGAAGSRDCNRFYQLSLCLTTHRTFTVANTIAAATHVLSLSR